MNTEKLAIICCAVAVVVVFGLMAFDECERRKHELEMAKAGFVRDGNKWIKAEGDASEK